MIFSFGTMSCPNLDIIIERFNDITQNPVKFLSVQTDLKDDAKNFVKSLYDYTKSQESLESNNKSSALSKLIVKDFDEEQIWQQLELQNSEYWNRLVSDVANCVNTKDNLKFPVKVAKTKKVQLEQNTADPELENLECEPENDEEMGSMSDQCNEAIKSNLKSKTKKNKGKASIVDDEFFKLNEMEQFLVKEEKKQTKKHGSDSDDESIDMFEDTDEDDDMEGEVDNEKNVMYSDFFDVANDDLDVNDGNSDDEESKSKPTKKRVRFSSIGEAGESSEDSVDDEQKIENSQVEKSLEKKSEFELRQQRLKQQIEKLENKTLGDNPWQLKGEVDASTRPQNSLLQEVVDFDLTSRPPPIITEQTTFTLEDIIKRRIKDKVFDDVIKKQKPVDDALVFRKPEILDHSKSKLSLAQIYETEYLKQKHSGEGQDDDPQEPESHIQIRDAMNKLFAKLDALSHYHYTPKPPQPEVKIVSNTPAINMEEVAPVAMSNAALLAPEEVKSKRKGDLMSKEERTVTDKNRERRKKKKIQKEKGKKFEKKDVGKFQKGLEIKDTKSIKTSKAFFQHLNDDVNSVIKNVKNKRKNVTNKGQ